MVRGPGRPRLYNTEDERKAAAAERMRGYRLKDKLFRTREGKDGSKYKYPISPVNQEYVGRDLQIQSLPALEMEDGYVETYNPEVEEIMRDSLLLTPGKDMRIKQDKRLPRIYSSEDDIHIILHYPNYYRTIYDDINDGYIIRLGMRRGGSQEIQSWIFGKESLIFDQNTKNAFRKIVNELVLAVDERRERKSRVKKSPSKKEKKSTRKSMLDKSSDKDNFEEDDDWDSKEDPWFRKKDKKADMSDYD